MEKSLKSSALNYGLYLGLILAAITIIGYSVSLDLFTEWWLGIFILILVIVFGIISAMSAKKLLKGFISFKNSFTAYFITVLIGLLISSVVSFVIFNVVDPEAASILQEKIMEMQVAGMEKFGMPQEGIDEAVRKIQENGSMYSMMNILKSIAFQLIGFSIVGLIVAAVVKRNDPDAA
jgi:hypothetical protein